MPVHQFTGFGEHDFGTLPFGAGGALAFEGMEFGGVITPDPIPTGFEIEALISQNIPTGIEFGADISIQPASGMEFDVIVSNPSPTGIEFDSINSNAPSSTGIEFFASPMFFFDHGAFGHSDFGSLPFGAQVFCAFLKSEFAATINDRLSENNIEFEGIIKDFQNFVGVEYEGLIKDFLVKEGIEFQGLIVDLLRNENIEFTAVIVDFLVNNGIEFEGLIKDFLRPTGIEFESIRAVKTGIEFIVVLYNTTRLRTLCTFDNRGLDNVPGGNNAWGNALGTGLTWVTNSQSPGDVEVNNLNTDIVEKYYESAGVSSIRLDNDTESISFMDTFCIDNHNLTQGSDIVVQLSNVSDFSVIGKTIAIPPRQGKIIHIEEELPLIGYRYVRVNINDPSNPENVKIGLIVFGSSVIMTGIECITDRIEKEQVHFADSKRTEGFTAVKNNRSLKDEVVIEFRNLEYSNGNYQTLQTLFDTVRTSLKCLWIPTPDINSPSMTTRFAVFAKMKQMPRQRHNALADKADYISFTIDLSEAE